MTDNINDLPYQLIDNFPSLARFRDLSIRIKHSSLSRALQNQIIERYLFREKLLDFGGGENSQYRHIIKCKSYSSINIDQRINPTWLIKENGLFPCEDNFFDHVFSFNTLEHVFDVDQKLSEIYRVLKPGGDILISTPFLLPIHGHPDDFNRFTPSWYYKALNIKGFKKVKVTPLYWGPFSSGLSSSGIPGPFKTFRKRLALIADLMLILIKKRKFSKSEIEELYMGISTVLVVQAIK